jgi:hypothetical protein
LDRGSGRIWRLFAVAGLLVLSCGPTRDAGRPVGDPCAPVAPGQASTECSSGLCIALDSASGVCSESCSSDENCPANFLCQAAGRYGKVCRKLTGCHDETECPSGHSCNAETGNCYIKVSRPLCSPCQDALQCAPGGSCFTALGSGEQFCTEACGANDQCPTGFACESIPAGEGKALIKQCVPATHTCNLGKLPCAPCTGDSECGGPHDLCVRNVVSGETFCGRDCSPERSDCPAGFSCMNLAQGDGKAAVSSGPYQCVPNSNTCQDFCDATTETGEQRQCGLGQLCNRQTQTCQAAADGRQCASCTDNDDCRPAGGPHPENRCVVNDCPSCPFKGEAFCATPCLDTAACVRSFGAGFVCQPVADSTAGAGTTKSYCLPQRGTCASGLGRLGDDCSRKGAGDCLAGVCLVAGYASICSLPCAQDSECGDSRYRCCEYSPDGYDCAPERRSATGPKSGAGVCAPLGGLFGDDCTPGRPPCQTGTCLDLGTARVCTVPCAAGCPDGFTCRKAQAATAGGDPISHDICFPAGGGLPGAACPFGPASCESGLCIRKDSGSICTAACVADSECPAGWSCQLNRAVDERSVQTCIPGSLQ